MTFGDLAPYAAAAVLGIGALWFLRRFGGGTALAELERANRILEKRVGEQAAEIKALTGELATLRSRTDVALAMAPVLKALELHEREAEKRAHRSLAVLDLIASRLGPDAEAA
jgi:hypothetical protein